MKKIVNLIPHTHWDKEWYFTKWESDVLLSKNINNLLDYLNDLEFKNFTLDGQASLIDDFLEFNPEKKDLLKKYIQEKRIIVGPWYTQPDLFSTSGESIVRNLLVGQKISDEFGSRMNVAYVPDSFGQSANMPQIYQQFDLKSHVYWRGINFAKTNNSALHNWVAPDGSSIKSFNLSKGYYVLGTYFPYLELENQNFSELGAKFLKDIDESLKEIASKMQFSDELIVPLGGDQAPIIKEIPKFIACLNELSDQYEFVYSDYESVMAKINSQKLPNYTGELKHPSVSKIHKTITSSRYDIKKLNRELEYAIFYRLEPLMAILNQSIDAHDYEILEQGIKKLLTCQAHDSLGGCCSDQTTDDILVRLQNANQLIDSLTIKILRTLAKNLAENDLLIFNFENYPTSFATLDIFTKNPHFEIKYQGQTLDYAILGSQMIKPTKHINLGTLGESVEGSKGYYQKTISLDLSKLPKTAISVLKIIEQKTSPVRKINQKVVETNRYRLSIQHQQINLFDKKNNLDLKNAFEFLACVDVGDTYDFSPQQQKINYIQSLSQLDFQVYEQNQLKFVKFTFDYHLREKNYHDQKINLVLTFKDDDVLDFHISLKNHNDMIKWIFKAKTKMINQKYSYANQVFLDIQKQIHLDETEHWKELALCEYPVEIESAEKYVYLKDQELKIGLGLHGTNEYQVDKTNGDLLITLFRSVDYLGKSNLLWRPGVQSGTGDFDMKTNNSRLLKKPLDFHLNYFITGLKTNLTAMMMARNCAITYYQKQNLNVYNRHFERFILTKLEKINLQDFTSPLIKKINENLSILNLKKSIYSDDHFLLRIVNTTSQKQTLDLEIQEKYFVIAGQTHLNEKNIQQYDPQIKGNEIKTIVLKRV